MRPYFSLTDEQLLSEIAQYRAALKEVTIGGGVGVIAGEGRRLEMTKADRNGIRAELRALYAEAAERGLEGYEDDCGGAIAVEIG